MASNEPPNRPAVCSCICTSACHGKCQLIATVVGFCTCGRVGVEAKCRCACYPLPLSLEHHQRPMLLAQQHVERNFQGHIFLVQCVVEVPSHESVLIVAPVVVLVVLAEQNLVQLVLVVVVEQLGLQVVSAQSWVTAVATLVLSWLVAAEARVAAFAPVLSWLALSQLVVVPAAAMGSLVAAEVLVAAGPVEPVEPHGQVASVAPMVNLLATVVVLQTAMGSLDPLGGWVSMGVVAVVPRRRKSPVVAQHQRPLWLGFLVDHAVSRTRWVEASPCLRCVSHKYVLFGSRNKSSVNAAKHTAWTANCSLCISCTWNGPTCHLSSLQNDELSVKEHPYPDLF